MSAAEFNFTFTYADKKIPALEDAGGKIEKGQCIVLCGGSGCGKSTLLRCINKLVPEFYEGELKGFCRLQNTDTKDITAGEAGLLAASVFQDPRSQFFTVNSTSEVAFGLENFGFSHEEIKKRTDNAFSGFGLMHLKDKDVFSLSSGQRQSIAILSAAALGTDIFLLDEPTANLDFHSVNKLRELLISLKNQGKTLIISEHRLYYLSGVADSFWLIDKGRIINKFSAEEMEKLKLSELHGMGLRTTDINKTGEKIIYEPEIKEKSVFTAENICFSYKKGKKILNGINIKASTGDVISLRGNNGCGKTTFGKTAAGLYKADSGNFYLDGKKLSAKQLSEESIFIMQEAEFQFFTNSVMNELSYPGRLTPEKKKQIEELLEKTGLKALKNQHPFSLSGGQMQKLVLLMAYMSPKKIVILDEPTAGLDYKSLCTCAELINEMRRTKIIFIITHDTELTQMVCTRAAVIEEGRTAKEFDLYQKEDRELLQEYTEKAPDSEKNIAEEKKKSRFLDPRTVFLLIIISMIIGVWTDLTAMLFTLSAVLAAALYQKQYKLSFISASLTSVLMVLYALFPDTLFSFAANFFPRIILIGTAAGMLIDEDMLPRITAGLRKLHVNEKIIMSVSVICRFFPVLSKDLGIMSQSIKTRGFYPRLTDKIKAVPQYMEILIVPMVFRVIRISETLSASAETRGIALKNKRQSYIKLKFTAPDFVIAALLIIFTSAGIVI